MEDSMINKINFMEIIFNLHSKMEIHKIKVKYHKVSINKEPIHKYCKTQAERLSLNQVNIEQVLAILIQYRNKMKQKLE